METGSSECGVVEKVLSVFQPHAKRVLTEEDAREIAHNLTGFMSVLIGWAAGEGSDDSGNMVVARGGEPGQAGKN
jgi:hypothetical protein